MPLTECFHENFVFWLFRLRTYSTTKKKLKYRTVGAVLVRSKYAGSMLEVRSRYTEGTLEVRSGVTSLGKSYSRD